MGATRFAVVAMPQNKPRERGVVTNWVTQEYGFVKREGRSTDDIHLHISNAKGEKFKGWIRRHGIAPGARVKFDVDFEQNRGRPYAANWEMVSPPRYSVSRSRSGSKKARRSPSYKKKQRRSPSRKKERRSPSSDGKKARRSPSVRR